MGKKIFGALVVVIAVLLPGFGNGVASANKAVPPAPNAGAIDGFGPVHFGMSPFEALRAAGKGARYTTIQSFEEMRWMVEYDEAGHHVEARFRPDETISHFVVHLLTQSYGIKTRGDCLQEDASRYKTEFEAVFHGLKMIDSLEQDHLNLLWSMKRIAAFRDGSSVLLDVYYIDKFGSCGANMMILPPSRPHSR